MRALLFDIEGTITSLDFVKNELYPYARNAIPEFVRSHAADPRIRGILDRVAAEARVEPSNVDCISTVLCRWIDEDRKQTELKELQGIIWEHGYREGAYRGHLYPDVLPFWRRSEGLRLAIYSSGSIRSQQLLLEYSTEGDVSRFVDRHYDTNLGPKGLPLSYQRIAQDLALEPSDVLFFSDSVAELDAASAVEMSTYRLVRPGILGPSTATARSLASMVSLFLTEARSLWDNGAMHLAKSLVSAVLNRLPWGVCAVCAFALLVVACSGGGDRPSPVAPNPQGPQAAIAQPPSVGGRAPTIINSEDLFSVYQAVLTSAVQHVEPAQLVLGAIKGAHAAASDQGLLPVEAAILDTSGASKQMTSDPQAAWADFGDAYDVLVQKLGSRIDVSAVGRGAARGMLAAVGDPVTTYLDRDAVQAMQSSRDAGIGVILTPSEGGAPMVRQVEPDGPAERAGLRPGDSIEAVGGLQSRGATLYDVLLALSGTDGSAVRVTVSAAGETPRDVSVTRARVRPPPVLARLVDGTEIVELQAFQPGSGDAIGRVLLDSVTAGATGWLLDLRGNGEGNSSDAASVASLFLGDQVLGTQEDRGAGEPVRGAGQALSSQRPLVVLVDGATAGPGELIAGALKDAGAATIVGTPTAGLLGTPRLIALSDGSAAEIAVGRMVSPSGRPLLGSGVQPDQTVVEDARDLAAGSDRAMEHGLSLLK